MARTQSGVHLTPADPTPPLPHPPLANFSRGSIALSSSAVGPLWGEAELSNT